MSHPSIKWIKGAPERLKVGMVLRSGAEVNLIGSSDMHANLCLDEFTIHMLNGETIEEHAQLVEDYVLEWLGSDGSVKGVEK